MSGANLGSNHRGPRIISEINVTPLVDIMLVLLIIFMVTATHIVRQSLEVKLPEAATAEPSKVTLLALTIDRSGKVKLNGERVDDAAIVAFIRQRKRLGEALEAVIAADKAVSHGQVVRIIDLVRAEGVRKFAINVLKPTTEQ